MTSICLAIVVKDAEESIERCIRAALPIIDTWVVVDTGSTDRTVEIVEDTLKDVPGRLLRSEWVRFDVNRTQLLQAARESRSEFTLMLDADMELQIAADAVDVSEWQLDADEYLITIDDRGMDYPLPLLTRNSKPFTYAGVAHACLNCTEPTTRGRIDGLRIFDHGGGPGRDGKFEKDLAALQAEVLRNPNDTRSWFYLAQTYRDLDRHEEAIEAYKHRAQMGGWDEEVYFSLYQAGMLLCGHVSYLQGAPLLLKAFEMHPQRAESLRGLAGCTTAVANKIPFPKDDLLFVERDAYAENRPPDNTPWVAQAVEVLEAAELLDDDGPVRLKSYLSQTEWPNVTARSPSGKLRPIKPRFRKVRTATGGYTNALNPKDVSAIVVTRGNVDLKPILEELEAVYGEVIVWDNSVAAPPDYKVFGRYAAIPLTSKPVLFWQDDDIIFRAHDELLAAYEPGVVISNMDADWIAGAGYGDFLAMVGAGSLCDADIPGRIWDEYSAHYPFDEEVLLECDFAFGTMAPFKRVDLGYQVRPFADDPDRLYQQPGQTQRKHAMIARGRELKRWREQLAEQDASLT